MKFVVVLDIIINSETLFQLNELIVEDKIGTIMLFGLNKDVLRYYSEAIDGIYNKKDILLLEDVSEFRLGSGANIIVIDRGELSFTSVSCNQQTLSKSLQQVA